MMPKRVNEDRARVDAWMKRCNELCRWGQWSGCGAAGRGRPKEGGIQASPPAALRGAWLQIHYLNSYYERIRAHVGPELRRQRLEEAYTWLQESTEPFPVSSAGTAAAGMLALASLLSVLLSGLGA